MLALPPGRGDIGTKDWYRMDVSDQETVQVTIYQAVGGQEFFNAMVTAFYERVANDDVLLRWYPEQVDHGPAIERLALFLGQFWGGPDTYSQQRGHPRLRARHVPYVISQTESDHWVNAMVAALDETLPNAPIDAELQQVVRGEMIRYFQQAADFLINDDDPSEP